MLDSDESGQTTYRLAAACVNRGHELWVMSTGGFAYDDDETVRARGRGAPARTYRSPEALVDALRDAEDRWVTVDELDMLLLRNNPSVQSPWAQHVGTTFGRIVRGRGVIVLNDPDGLARASGKLYLQSFPAAVRPATLVTRDRTQIRRFADRRGTIVIKPLQGSGGRSVFVIRPDDHRNLDEMIHAVSRDGYVIAQEYLPAAAEGDTRLFVMNGRPLEHRGRYAAFRRVRSGGDLRSNIHAGGRLRKAEVTETMLRLAEMVRPRLVEDGMFLVGLDIVGDKLMELNVFSPGGLGSAQLFEKVDFADAVVAALERKVHYMTFYDRDFSNVDLATL